MNLIGRIFPARIWSLALGAALALGLTGCGTLLTPKHKVTVDAICAPGATKPAGLSYRIQPKRTIGLPPATVNVVSACVGAALAHAGMYEAPASVPADLVIEMNCGQDNPPRGVDPTTRETFLELSARTNKDKSMTYSRDPELWNVRVSIQGLMSRMEQAMPLLSAVASSYTAMDTRFQTMIEVPQNNASIAAVREAAIKTLEASGTLPRAAAGTGTASTAQAGTAEK